MLWQIRSVASLKRQNRETFARWQLEPTHLVWALGSLYALNRIPFDAELLLKQFPPPYSSDTLIHASRTLGFRIKLKFREAADLGEVAVPCLALLAPDPNGQAEHVGNTAPAESPRRRPALVSDSLPMFRPNAFNTSRPAPTRRRYCQRNCLPSAISGPFFSWPRGDHPFSIRMRSVTPRVSDSAGSFPIC